MFVVPCVLLGPEEAGASYAGRVYPSFRTTGPPLSNNESPFASALAPHRPLISLQFCSQSRPITLSYNPQCNNISVCSTVNYRRVSACDLMQLDRSARSGGNWSDWSIRACATCPSHTLCLSCRAPRQITNPTQVIRDCTNTRMIEFYYKNPPKMFLKFK